ncbi:hypothetical protein Patl1_05716 [Pistacia atlantica]|uniref:Uncharacterized protein n=1 Tax=Pistacia atlantica TaxID=434234 RepID=A0ACC1BT01_9ROSI|nr:hypothetical protein Patl1_05716 [Pistacia atlantica]
MSQYCSCSSMNPHQDLIPQAHLWLSRPCNEFPKV